MNPPVADASPAVGAVEYAPGLPMTTFWMMPLVVPTVATAVTVTSAGTPPGVTVPPEISRISPTAYPEPPAIKLTLLMEKMTGSPVIPSWFWSKTLPAVGLVGVLMKSVIDGPVVRLPMA